MFHQCYRSKCCCIHINDYDRILGNVTRFSQNHTYIIRNHCRVYHCMELRYLRFIISGGSFLDCMPALYAIKFDWSSILMILPAAFVLVPEHIGHLFVTSNIVGNDLTKDPGLGRSFIGNGVSTMISSFVGSTPNTTYGENIGVLAITRVYSTFVIGIAAVMPIVLSFIS